MRQLFVAGLACVALLAGCSLPRVVTGTFDAGAEMDALVRPSDAGVDATAPDAFVVPVDSGVDGFVVQNDAGDDAFIAPIDAWSAPDAWLPPNDASIGPAGDASTPCDRAYGNAPGYVSCAGTTSVSCVFFVNWTGGSSDDCDHVCGSRCVGGIGNVDGTSCSTTGSPFACNQNFQDAICTCLPP